MRILIAPDKFKGSLNAAEVAENIASGLRDVLPDAILRALPVADGGEGTVAAIHGGAGGDWIKCPAHDALGRPVEVRYLWLAERATGVMEMSEAAGLWRIPPGERDLLRANTYGVGEMIEHAIGRGAKGIVLGLGGSATNDGGFGMALALGFRFLGKGHSLSRSSGRAGEQELKSPGELLTLNRIVFDPAAENSTALSGRVREAAFPKVVALADVRNPLLGARGATRTFGPQKGGTPEQLEMIERALTQLADVVRRDLGCDYRDAPGVGAAGGLGFGLMTFCGASVKPGFEMVAEFIGLTSAIENADVVITGEGRLDEQTLEGKAPAGVARLARAAGKRVFAIAGSSSETPVLRDQFEGIVVLARPPITPEESVARAAELLRERARELARML